MPAAQKRTQEEEERLEREFIGAGEPEPEVAAEEGPQEPIMFRSKGVNFRAVMVPRHRWTAPNGEVQVTDGKTLEFAPAGEYTTADPAEIRHLRSLPTFNREFWEVGSEPHAIPSPRPIMDKVVTATVALDDEELARLEEEERNSWARPFVLDSIRSARERVQGAINGAAEVKG